MKKGKLKEITSFVVALGGLLSAAASLYREYNNQKNNKKK